MEKDLIELFERVKKASDMADSSPADEDLCVDALKQLTKFPVNYQLLVSTQVGKRLRQLTRHKSDRIKSLSSELVEMWKKLIVKETMKNKNGTTGDAHSVKAESAATAETNEHEKVERKNSFKIEQKSSTNNTKIHSSHRGTLKSEEISRSDFSSTFKSKRVEVVKEKASSELQGSPKLASLVYCKDPLRDKFREILAEALCKVCIEVDEDLKKKAEGCDPNRVAVLVETAMFEKWGKSNGAQKFKYRSIMFNIKDPNNPDFRRKVLLGDVEPLAILEMSPEEMASDARQSQNEKIKEKALFNSELGGPPKASTNEFTCGRCKKKETTYYQLQTRSADEPMTTFVTCVNCNNRWKF